jgi:hypothetical protein
METTQPHKAVGPAEKALEHAVVGGTTIEAIGGAAAVVLSIIGLARIFPGFMAAVSAIALGVALLFEGGFIASEYSRILKRSGNGKLETAELGGGLSTQTLAGGAVIVLGILSLLGIATWTLLPISALILGAGVLFGSGVASRLNAVKIETSEESERAQRIAHEMVSATAAGQVLVGLSAIVLGILALIGIAPDVLTLVAMLAVGASILLTGSAVTGRMLTLFRA